MQEFVIQGIGFVGLAFFFISYQIKSNKTLFAFQLAGSSIFLVQMCLLGAATGALAVLVTMTRNLLMMKSGDWKWVQSKITLTAIIAFLAVSTVLTWDGWPSLLPFICISVTCIGYWSNNAQKIRLSQLIGSPCTLVYDIFVRSWGGAMAEATTIISIIASIIRFGWRNMGEDKGSFR